MTTGDLSPICRATLFDEEVRFSENIDFQFPMKEACKGEIKRFCKVREREGGGPALTLMTRQYDPD